MMSATVFYKYIVNPIARVDQGNAAAVLTCMNVSNNAQEAGLEVEFRKNLFNVGSSSELTHRLALGINGSL